MSRPSSEMIPAVGASMPAIRPSRVDLPLPDGRMERLRIAIMAPIIQNMPVLPRTVCCLALLAVSLWACDQQIGKPAPKIQGTSVDARPGTKAPPPSNAAPRPEERVLVAFGDSLTD